ncbi:hypothetical protein [Streptomyces sp. NPDC017673]|uniref:hypothetical protein n=1 Tax=unclassified Streptomyces TaxID=2593676 RepID=UPI0037ABDA61
MREDRRREKAGGGLAVVPAARSQGVGEPGVNVGLNVPAGSPGELVADGFVAVAGLGLLQGAELAQRLELIGAGRDPGGLPDVRKGEVGAQLGFPGSGGRGVGGEPGLDDVVKGGLPGSPATAPIPRPGSGPARLCT